MMENVSIDRKNPVDEEVGFLSGSKPQVDDASVKLKDEFGPLLTREDLQNLDTEQPVWRRVRLGLFIVFWIIWVGLLAASILIIVFTPKCPPRPHLNFWQSKVGYWIDPFAFRDSTGDLIGDFNGIVQKLGYIKDSIGAGFIVLGSFLEGHFSKATNIGAVKDYMKIDSAVGTMDDFRYLVKTLHKQGMQVVITLDFNSISSEHVWAKNGSLLTKFDSAKHKVSRAGTNPVSQFDPSYYSVLNPSVVDLNLESEETFENIKDVLKFWLGEGVDGVMLTNAAFFVENKDPSGAAEATGASNWYKNVPRSQIYTNESVAFVRKLRKVLDEIASASGKTKLLMVDPGDVGYGVIGGADKSIEFVGTADEPAAHAVVTRELASNRGWKSTPTTADWSRVGFWNIPVLENASYVLSTATPTDLHYGDPMSLFTSVLLPGTPLIYYGSELNLNIPNGVPPTKIYPMGKTSIMDYPSEVNVLLSHMPMPWDRSGSGFSTAGTNNSYFKDYIEQFQINETVESALAVGRSTTTLKFLKELITLRENPSVLWGDLKVQKSKSDAKFTVFVRSAQGFPEFIVAFTRQIGSGGEVYDFSSICGKVSLKLAYPSNQGFEINKSVDSARIYLSMNNSPSMYIFVCS